MKLKSFKRNANPSKDQVSIQYQYYSKPKTISITRTSQSILKRKLRPAPKRKASKYQVLLESKPSKEKSIAKF